MSKPLKCWPGCRAIVINGLPEVLGTEVTCMSLCVNGESATIRVDGRYESVTISDSQPVWRINKTLPIKARINKVPANVMAAVYSDADLMPIDSKENWQDLEKGTTLEGMK